MDKRTIIAKIDTIVVRNNTDISDKDKIVAIRILKHQLENLDKKID